MRWRAARALGDQAALDSLRLRFDSLHSVSLERILGYAQLDGAGLEDAERAARALREPVSRTEPVNIDTRMVVLYLAHAHAASRGRPGRATALLRDEIWRGGTDHRGYFTDRLETAL